MPPEYNGDVLANARDEIRRFAIDRHQNGSINGLFVDFSVRKLGLKQLFTLKWHKQYDIANEWTLAGGATYDKWANHGTGWMKKYKEY